MKTIVSVVVAIVVAVIGTLYASDYISRNKLASHPATNGGASASSSVSTTDPGAATLANAYAQVDGNGSCRITTEVDKGDILAQGYADAQRINALKGLDPKSAQWSMEATNDTRELQKKKAEFEKALQAQKEATEKSQKEFADSQKALADANAQATNDKAAIAKKDAEVKAANAALTERAIQFANATSKQKETEESLAEIARLLRNPTQFNMTLRATSNCPLTMSGTGSQTK